MKWHTKIISLITGNLKGSKAKPILEIVFEGGGCTGDGSGEMLPPMPLHIWIQSARLESAITGHSTREENAAVIEAIRDFLFNERFVPLSAQEYAEILTQEAAIARGES